jgi:hypothetical protein
MKIFKSIASVFLRGTVLALLAAATSFTQAQTIWNGPAITFSHTPANGLADHLTPGVAITRGSSGGLYNPVTESGAVGGVSPKDTLWAVGALTNFSKLTYGACPLEAFHSPGQFVGTTYIVHLVAENIYLSLTLTGWGGEGQTGDTTFSYIRSTPAVAAPPAPTVSLTSPTSGAIFAAPANVSLAANATVSSGTVTNVKFFADSASQGALATSVSQGDVGVAPFTFTFNGLAAGSYALTAVATASGISTTSAVVNVSVVVPVPVNLSSSAANNGQFSFSYSANPGLTYIVQNSSNLLDWVSLETNVASGSTVLFSNVSNSTGAGFYRVGRLPDP